MKGLSIHSTLFSPVPPKSSIRSLKTGTWTSFRKSSHRGKCSHSSLYLSPAGTKISCHNFPTKLYTLKKVIVLSHSQCIYWVQTIVSTRQVWKTPVEQIVFHLDYSWDHKNVNAKGDFVIVPGPTMAHCKSIFISSFWLASPSDAGVSRPPLWLSEIWAFLPNTRGN